MSFRYALQEQIRMDRFVESWRAVDERTGQVVVLRRTVLTNDPVADDRIVHRFRTEAAAFARRNLPGFPALLDFGIEGYAWMARHWIEARETDPERLLAEGAEAFAALHESGLLHLNLHPGNALRGSLGLVICDPGGTRDWVRDGGVALPDPNPAPEQGSATGRRGPWTDVWRLAATAVALGHPMTEVLRQALEIDPVHRPQNGAALEARLRGERKGSTVFALNTLDEQLIRLNRFSYEPRACPGCGGVLTEPKPLPPGRCPVCREGHLTVRKSSDLLCPACHGGILQRSVKADPPAACPRCTVGRLRVRRNRAACPRCDLELVREGGKWSDGERALTSEEWRADAGRTPVELLCDGCDAQFDVLPDGRRIRKAGPSDLPPILTPLESARLADFAPLDGGDACCPMCSAEFLCEPDALTLVSYFDDPFGFASRNLGRRLPKAYAAREAAGLGDPSVRSVCEICGLTMSARREDLVELRGAPQEALAPHLGERRTLEDWHRLAQGLPPEAEEGAFARTVEAAMRRAYLSGELGFDFTTSVLWHGPAIRDGRRVTLKVTDRGLEFRRGIRRTRISLDSFWAARAAGERLVLLRTGGPHVEVQVAPRDLPVDLKSGRRTVRLEAKELAARIGRELVQREQKGADPVPEAEPIR